jgi:phosphatidylinositol glycan class T
LPPPRTRTRVRGSDGGDGGDGGERSPLLDAVARRGEWNAAEVMYTDGSLLPWPTPDFSMPFNIITMTSTVMALLSGLMMRELTARHGWRTGERAKNARRARREREAKKMAKRAALLRRLRACAIS